MLLLLRLELSTMLVKQGAGHPEVRSLLRTRLGPFKDKVTIKEQGLCHSEAMSLCSTTACFERNLYNQIFGGDSVQSTTFCGNQVMDTTFSFHDPL